MRLLWLCNVIPGAIRQAMGNPGGSGLWMDHVLSGLRRDPGPEIRILCRGDTASSGSVDERLSYVVFEEPVAYTYYTGLEDLFSRQLWDFQHDAVHIWGTEYGHTLAMMNACRDAGLLKKTCISIQGLCGVYARHYAEGVPYGVQRGHSLRDLVRRDNILAQQRKYALRGELEAQALSLARHVLGRTHWDRACMELLAPQAEYHLCRETLREPFYEGRWRYEACVRHRIFAPSLEVPLKGYHYLLEAFCQVLKTYPDATLAVPGKSFLELSGKEACLQQTYHAYLARFAKEHGLQNKLLFLGHLSPEEMKQAYLNCNVFVLPSTIENSPNSLGEAMLLGVPCVASDVGGVTSMLEHEKEGLVYQSSAPYVLAHHIARLFDLKADAAGFGAAASARARITHDPEENRKALLGIYETLSQEEKE